MSDFLKELYEIEKEYYIKLPNDIRECNYIGLRYKGTLLNYIESNIDRLVEFLNCDKNQGVYLTTPLAKAKGILSIITSFTARLYGRRRSKRMTEKIIENAKKE